MTGACQFVIPAILPLVIPAIFETVDVLGLHPSTGSGGFARLKAELCLLPGNPRNWRATRLFRQYTCSVPFCC